MALNRSGAYSRPPGRRRTPAGAPKMGQGQARQAIASLTQAVAQPMGAGAPGSPLAGQPMAPRMPSPMAPTPGVPPSGPTIPIGPGMRGVLPGAPPAPAAPGPTIPIGPGMRGTLPGAPPAVGGPLMPATPPTNMGRPSIRGPRTMKPGLGGLSGG